MIYDIAGLRIAIENEYGYTDALCRGYLSSDQQSPADIVARTSREEMEEEKKGLLQDFSDGYIENICLYRNLCQQILLMDRFLLHASVLEYEGQGYAFLGKSGTGKSTHSRLWLRYVDGAKIVNGDKPIVLRNGKEFIAYGTPWMGKENLGCNTRVPLKALCFLEQAKENSIQRISLKNTVRLIFPQILHASERANMEKMLEMVDAFVQEVPAYLLRCDISEEAVKTSFETLCGKEYQGKKREVL